MRDQLELVLFVEQRVFGLRLLEIEAYGRELADLAVTPVVPARPDSNVEFDGRAIFCREPEFPRRLLVVRAPRGQHDKRRFDSDSEHVGAVEQGVEIPDILCTDRDGRRQREDDDGDQVSI